MKSKGITMTVGGNLAASHVIFVDSRYKAEDWRSTVLDCLQMAEDNKMSTIAFPALGTSMCTVKFSYMELIILVHENMF